MAAVDLLPAYLDHLVTLRQAPKHIEHIEQMLRDAQSTIGKLLVEIDKADLRRYAADLARRPIAAATVRKYQCAVRGFFAWAVDEEHLTADPARRAFRSPKLPKRVPIHLEADEQDALLAAVDGGPWYQARNRLVFALGMYAGLRASEALGLDWEHVSRRESTITVIGKGDKQRVVFVSDRLWAYLDAWQASSRRTSGPVIEGPWGPDSRMTYDHLRRLTNRTMRLAGLTRRRFTFHKLRHTYATMLRRAGVELDVIQHQMGHEDISTTTIYAHSETGEAAKAAINAAMGAATPPPGG
jgi:site-specific recombinase XerD